MSRICATEALSFLTEHTSYWDNNGDNHPEYDFDAGISVPYIKDDDE